MNRQIRQLGAVLVVLFLILFVQLNNVQILQAAKLNDNPRNNRNAVRDFSTPRGAIQTADGTVVAQSVPTDDQYKYLRQYPQGELYGQLTGFFSFNYGNEGLERTYNKDLTGKTYALKNIGDLLTDRVRVNNVTLSVDSKLQQLARDQLRGRKGSVVALDPKTGAILAMYSNPNYDPNPLTGHDFTAVTNAYNSIVKAQGNPMLPRAYRETYAPGSTFKVITSSAAYDKKPELITKRYPSVTTIGLPDTNKTLSNFGHETCGGAIADLLRVSCNTGFAQMGLDLGGNNLSAEAQSFGFNQAPPLDLPSVAKSRFPTADKFVRNRPGVAYSAIGQQDVAATPLQMALVAAGIANNGVIMKPTLMKEVRDQHGDVVRSANYGPWLRATSSDTAGKVKDLMIGVANAGTATAAKIPGVQVAAKTGTAQTGNNTVHTWLISFAPADDPKVAVAVILENQPAFDDATGGVLAAPIAREMMKAALGVK
jgi:penicillin-binding protein A